MFIALYYPAMTPTDDYCEAGDMVGTGTASCVDTLNCVGACPPAGDTSQTNGYSPCLQKCVANSCPGAAGPLGTVKACVEQECAAECGAADGGVSDACRTCVTGNCAGEYIACAKAPCQVP
jgi:hypothetical protein